MRDVTKQLLKPGVVRTELAELLQMRLQRCAFTTETRVDFPDEKAPVLTIYYGRDREIRRIESSLGEEEISSIAKEIDDKLVTSPTRQFGQQILFAQQPVVGKWDGPGFSIVEAPAAAPRPPWQIGDYPAMIEFPVAISTDHFTTAERIRRRATELMLPMRLFVPSLRLNTGQSRSAWGVAAGSMSGPTFSPQWTQETYGFDGFTVAYDKARSASFSKLIDTVPFQIYDPHVTRPGEDLTLPDSLFGWFKLYDQLNPEARTRFDRAAYWLRNSREACRVSASASLISAVQAVETLTASAKQDICSTCGKMTGPGPTQMFRKFMEEYAPASDETSANHQKQLYKRRSQMTHGHRLMTTDIEIQFGISSPAAAEEWALSRYASAAVRVALINWLVTCNSPKGNASPSAQ